MKVGWIVAAAVLVSFARISAQTPTFSSRVEGVRVDVLVNQRNRPVLGLTPADFEVRDNGVLQKVDVMSYGEIPLNVVLTFDASESVVGDRLNHLRTAGQTLVDALDRNDQAALITFNQTVRQYGGLSRDRTAIRSGLAEVVAVGETALIDAAFAGMMAGESDVGRSLLIVFSDGIDSASWLPASGVLEAARRADVVVYGVAVGQSKRPEFLSDLCELTGGTLVSLERTSDLATTFRRILDEFRQRYLLTFAPTGVTAGGWHRLDVRIKRPGVTVKARPGYQADSK